MTLVLDPVMLVLIIPAVAAAVLALLPTYTLAARVNVAATFLTFVSALGLFFISERPDGLLLIDDLNIVFIVLTTFVGFTTSIFSSGYIAHELEIGRLTPLYLRFYHAMYQILMFGMNLALIGGLLDGLGLEGVRATLAPRPGMCCVALHAEGSAQRNDRT